MKNNNFITIVGWMANELKLGGNDLLVYALIYGFSQDGNSWFSGSRQYIADTLNISKMTVDRSIKKLIEKGYIIKDCFYQNDIKFNRYKVADNSIKECDTHSQNVIGVVTKCDGGWSQNVMGGGNNLLPNIDNNKIIGDNIDNTNRKNNKVYYPEDERLNNAFTDFVEMRKKIKKPMTDRAITLAMNELDKLAGTDKDLAVEIVNQSVLRGWQTFYPLKHEATGSVRDKLMGNQSLAEKWGL